MYVVLSSSIALDRNVWENSGLLEGDIMESSNHQKNGLLNAQQRWPNATIPFFIEDDFSKIKNK